MTVRLVSNTNWLDIPEFLLIKVLPACLLVWGFWRTMTRKEIIMFFLPFGFLWLDERVLILSTLVYSIWFIRTGQYNQKWNWVLVCFSFQILYWTLKTFQRFP